MPASDLGAIVVKEVLKRANTNAADVNEVIIGQVNIVSFYQLNYKLFFLSNQFLFWNLKKKCNSKLIFN